MVDFGFRLIEATAPNGSPRHRVIMDNGVEYTPTPEMVVLWRAYKEIEQLSESEEERFYEICQAPVKSTEKRRLVSK